MKVWILSRVSDCQECGSCEGIGVFHSVDDAKLAAQVDEKKLYDDYVANRQRVHRMYYPGTELDLPPHKPVQWQYNEKFNTWVCGYMSSAEYELHEMEVQ